MKLKVPNTRLCQLAVETHSWKQNWKILKSEWEKRVFLISLFGNSLWLTAVKLPQLLTWQVKITLKECFQSSKLVALRLNLLAQLSSATETLEKLYFECPAKESCDLIQPIRMLKSGQKVKFWMFISSERFKMLTWNFGFWNWTSGCLMRHFLVRYSETRNIPSASTLIY